MTPALIKDDLPHPWPRQTLVLLRQDFGPTQRAFPYSMLFDLGQGPVDGRDDPALYLWRELVRLSRERRQLRRCVRAVREDCRPAA